ncbi:DUF3718 domain-containing protein [Gallaecimonas sp. GXIMD1310]|uniref:DUF3718 domain-containing protein n=1 Tax=Gallaecimonas sp. GXIMD1310 TaxID=3131926 RepID=UPI00324C4053
MKRLILFAAATLLASTAAHARMDPYLHDALVSVCKASATDRPIVLNNTLTSYRLSYPTVAQKLVCNGQSVYQFALSHGAHRNAERLFSRGRLGEVIIEDLSRATPNTAWRVSF